MWAYSLRSTTLRLDNTPSILRPLGIALIQNMWKKIEISRTYDFLVMFLHYVQLKLYTTWKVSKHGVFSGPYFLAFGMNMEIYCVNLRIQSEYRKIRTKKNKSPYSVRIKGNTDQKKTPYLDTFQAVLDHFLTVFSPLKLFLIIFHPTQVRMEMIKVFLR